jgi:hypothetical protein
MSTIKVGDTISYYGNFGKGPLVKAKVLKMEITLEGHEKFGRGTQEVSIDLVRQDKVVFDLDNKTWCYGKQVDCVIDSNGQLTFI